MGAHLPSTGCTMRHTDSSCQRLGTAAASVPQQAALGLSSSMAAPTASAATSFSPMAAIGNSSVGHSEAASVSIDSQGPLQGGLLTCVARCFATASV